MPALQYCRSATTRLDGDVNVFDQESPGVPSLPGCRVFRPRCRKNAYRTVLTWVILRHDASSHVIRPENCRVVELQWARLKNTLDVPLRREHGTASRQSFAGSGDHCLRKTVTVPRPFIDIRNTPPTRMDRPDQSYGRPTHARTLSTGYLVCRNADIASLPPKRLVRQLCPRCSGTFTIAWDEHYLEKSTRIV